MSLSHWDDFNSMRSNQSKLWKQRMPTGLTTRINVFKARYDVAARLDSMVFAPEFEDDTTRAYLAGTKLLLAYSAGEAYMRAEDLFRARKPVTLTSWSISRAGLARSLRPLVRLILEQAENHGSLNASTKGYLVKFSEDNSSDVRPVATALRHVHAHGGLTARTLTGSADNQASGHIYAVEELAQALLERSDEKFSGLVKELEARLHGKQ